LKKSGFVACLTISAALFFVAGYRAASETASPPVSVRILFGVTDTAPTAWDGTVKLDSGTVKAIQGVRFGPKDSTDYSTSWTASTRAQGQEVIENGVLITAFARPDARWSIHLPKGDFSFTLNDLPWGERRSFLDGAVEVDRVPPTAQLTTSDDDEDVPAAARSSQAQGNGEIWVSYVKFSHANRSLESFQVLRTPLDDFAYLARPAGGDQIFAMRYAPSTGNWSGAVPVSPPGEIVERTAIAIDGQNRVWVFWSAERDGNFDLFARAGRNGFWEPELRLTSNAGADLAPVAATDARGRVWVAWQGYRKHNFEVLTAVQNGAAFSPEEVVSVSRANNWAPAIAAASNGDMAVSWDTYDKGDYDVYFCRMRANAKAGIEMDPPVAAAATPLFEAHSSVAFDRDNRLWLAYEVSTARWGQSFGAWDTRGTPLYEYRSVRVKYFDGRNVYSTSSDILNALPGTPIGAPHEPAPRPNRNPLQPNPNLARNRKPGHAVGPRNGPLNSFPRLATDAAGGVYLAFRTLTRPLNLRSPLGAVWSEFLVYFDGHKWVGPVYLPRTDGLLDSRPALLALGPGHLLSISAMDHRQSIPQAMGPLGALRINSDLYSADLRLEGLAPPTQMPELMALQPEARPAPDPALKAEAAQIALVRNYRIEAGGRQLRILRGDLHRYSEYSMDGARDGPLADAYRYMIDAAALDWGGCCDYDNGGGHEYFWWRQQTMTDAFYLGGRFTPMFSFERQAHYPEGHRVVLFAKRGIRPLPHLPVVPVDAPPGPSPDVQMLYKYLRAFGGISVPYAPATDLGSDWRDNDAEVESAVEIYQGNRQSYESEDAPRAANQEDAIGNLRPLGYVSQALDKGYRLGFVASSDHHSTHTSYANVLAPEPTREAILDALKARHVYASTDNIIADVRCGDHIMGDEFEMTGQPRITVKLYGAAPFAKVVIVKDGKEIYRAAPNAQEVSFDWTDAGAIAGKTSYYYVRGEQADGQLVWASPMWITAK
jgi:hypothetical protein